MLLLLCSVAHCQTGRTDSAIAKVVKLPPVLRTDTAIVRTYSGVPVFYHCKPLHHYTIERLMTRSSFVNYSSQAFERYVHAAKKKAKGDIGILIDNLNFGTDSFYVVRFSPADGRADSAVYSTPIFLSARPTKPYKVVRVISDKFSWGSLNASLQTYLKDARDLHIPFDGIIVNDINYAFANDDIMVIKWKKR